jgi:hypothetical protein
MLPTHNTADRLPAPRRNGPLSRPHRRSGAGRWRWQGPATAATILAAGNPFHDEARWVSRLTPAGLTETELLASFNYLDQEALLAFEGIGPTLSANILAQRAKAQYFASLDELALVPLIGPKRFTRLTGRAPEAHRFRLHDLMRRSRQEALYLADLQPWVKPAPGIVALHVSPAAEPVPGLAADQLLLTVRVKKFHLHFVCTEPPTGGRAAFLHQNLPGVLRTLLP